MKPIAVWCIYKPNAFKKWPDKGCLEIATGKIRRNIKSDRVKRTRAIVTECPSVLGLAAYMKFSGPDMGLAGGLNVVTFTCLLSDSLATLGGGHRGGIIVYR